jgi:hypothetical protein
MRKIKSKPSVKGNRRLSPYHPVWTQPSARKAEEHLCPFPQKTRRRPEICEKVKRHEGAVERDHGTISPNILKRVDVTFFKRLTERIGVTEQQGCMASHNERDCEKR